MNKRLSLLIVWAMIGLASSYGWGKLEDRKMPLIVAIVSAAFGPLITVSYAVILIGRIDYGKCVLNCGAEK
jgi:hypothetical protein